MARPIRDFQTVSHLSLEQIALYVDALKLQRTSELPEKLCEHVSDCQDCRKEVTGLFSILAEENYAAMGSHPYFDRSGKGRPKRFRWAYQIAALVTAGVGVSILAYLHYTGGGESTSGVLDASRRSTRVGALSGDSAAIDSSKALGRATYDDRFAEFPELETLVAAETRSTGIDVVSPTIGESVHQPIVFNWKADSDVSVLLSILTNTDSLVRRVRISALPYVLRSSLAPGLYYWKLEGEDEVLFVGKFVVR